MRPLAYFILICFILASCSDQQAYLVNGRVSSKQEVDELDSSEIFSFEKWRPAHEQSDHHVKGDEATIIAVRTKAAEVELQKQQHALLNLILDLAQDGREILIVQNGVLILSSEYEDLRKLSGNQFSSAFLMAWHEAKGLYGSSAKPITLVLNTFP